MSEGGGLGNAAHKAFITAVAGAAGLALVGYLVYHFGFDPSHPKPRAVMTAFNITNATKGNAPIAQITVENEGGGTLNNCTVNWRPGMTSFGTSPEILYSTEFSLDAGKTETVTLTSPVAYAFIGSATSVATFSCDNGSDSRQRILFIA